MPRLIIALFLAVAAFAPGAPVLVRSEAAAQETPPPQTPIPLRPTRDCEHEGPVTS